MHMLFIPQIFAVITEISALAQIVQENRQEKAEFAVTGTVSAVMKNGLYLLNEGKTYCKFWYFGRKLNAGDRIFAKGFTVLPPYGWCHPDVLSAKKIGTAPIPDRINIQSDSLSDGSLHLHNVSIRAIVMDAFKDAIDPRYIMLALRDRHGVFHATVETSENVGKRLIGATVTLSGIIDCRTEGKRPFGIPHISVPDEAHIKIIDRAPKNPCEVPLLECTSETTVNTIAGMSLRRAEGTVLATWQGNRILIKTGKGQIMRLELARAHSPSTPQALPEYGEKISAIGFPASDFFTINLSHASFLTLATATETHETPIEITSKDIFQDKKGGYALQTEYYGRLVRLSGKIIALPHHGRTGLLELDSGGYRISVDVSRCLEKALACIPESKVDITGICVLNTENWRPLEAFPHTDGMTIVARNNSDLVVTKMPPWWTIGRLLVFSGILLGIIAVILVWNWFLRIVIERKSRLLYRAEIEKAETTLLIDERTRLAVELHDNVAQSLTGVSFQIDAAEKTLAENSDAAKFLAIAKRTLLSCRKELRRCLWDLRSHTIEEPVFENAILKTLKPHMGTAEISIRFGIQRSMLSDTVAHAILCIIRELAINALTHGKATRIDINGERKKRYIVFSVSDNGTGFDVENQPGPSQGHFGLQGIQERIDRFNGVLKIVSIPNEGTKATVVLK